GQISEVLFLLLLPLFIKRYGIKSALIVGILAWGVRYLLFAYGDTGAQTWMLLFGLTLHGICYDFFFVTGQLYTDRVAPAEIRTSAQALVGLLTYGAGMLVGNYVLGYW
ncbi:MAG: MFS transporter, partial [Flavobacteriaceae bacterium]